MSSAVDVIVRHSLVSSSGLGELLANRYDSRRLTRLTQRLFYEWREECCLLNSARKSLLRCFVQKVGRRHMHEWRRVARRTRLLRRAVRCKFMRRRKLFFSWWKYSVRWEALKYTLLSTTFDIWRDWTIDRIDEQWDIIVNQSSRIVYRFVLRQHRKRRFWARKTIKAFLTRSPLFVRVVLGHRKSAERKRRRLAALAIEQLIERAVANFSLVLESDDGRELKAEYIKDVRDTLHSIAVGNYAGDDGDEVFPGKDDMPSLYKLWTVPARALLVAEERCKYEVASRGGERLRRKAPALYECGGCRATFSLARERGGHIRRCALYAEWASDPGYSPPDVFAPPALLACLAWRMCRHIVAKTLRPLHSQLT